MAAPSNPQADSATAPRTTFNPVAKTGSVTSTSTATVVHEPPGYRGYFLKWLGAESSPGFTMPHNVKKLLFPTLWFVITIFLCYIIDLHSKYSVLQVSHVATSFMIFYYPNEPGSQPRNIILGHFTAALIGLIFNEIILVAPTCYTPVCVALYGSITAAITAFVMMVFPDFLHIPALITAVSAGSFGQKRWQFLGTPAIAGSLLVIAFGLVFNNILERYPRYW